MVLQAVYLARAADYFVLQHVQLHCNRAESMLCQAGAEHRACTDQRCPGQDCHQPYRPPDHCWRLSGQGRCAHPAQPTRGRAISPGLTP